MGEKTRTAETPQRFAGAAHVTLHRSPSPRVHHLMAESYVAVKRAPVVGKGSGVGTGRRAPGDTAALASRVKNFRRRLD